MPPIIGILGAHGVNNAGPAPISAAYVNDAYCISVLRAGGVPVLLPVPEQPHGMDAALALCQGLLLPGGADVDPRLYGEDPLPALGPTDLAMDRFWLRALEYAAARHLPALGICRGLQLANVALGGSLYQDVGLLGPARLLHQQRQSRQALVHRVQLQPGSRLEQLLGPQPLYTNTLHHQCVKQPGQGLAVTARTADGVVEGMESADGRLLLVQWHPEELWQAEPRMRALFTDLVRRAEG